MISPNRDRVGKRIHAAGHIIFLKSLRLRIEVANLSFLKFTEPYRTVGINRDPAFIRVKSWRHPLLHFQRLGIHFADLACPRICEPHVFILVEGQAVRVRRFRKIIKFPGLGIEARQRIAARPNHAFRVDAHRMPRPAVFSPLHAGKIRVLILGNFLRRRIPPAQFVGSLFGKPDGAVRRGDSGVHRRGPFVRNRKILHFARLRIEPRDLVSNSEIRDPDGPVLGRRGAERHAARARHVVFDVRNVHGLARKGPHGFLVSRQVGW